MLETTTEFRVRYAETDQMGVVYHTNYLIWCEVGRTDLLRQLGATYAELERRGVYLAVAEVGVRFLAAARYDDLIRVRTTLSKARSRAVRFAYVLENAETHEILARAETDLICLDREGSPRKLPAALKALLQSAADGATGEGTIGTNAGVDVVADA
ncbi:MAG: thioesterase family protein [Gemmatimonadota bacterium]